MIVEQSTKFKGDGRDDGIGGSTARGLWCVTKATRKVGVAEEVGGGSGRRGSSCGESEMTLIGEEAGIISVKFLQCLRMIRSGIMDARTFMRGYEMAYHLLKA